MLLVRKICASVEVYLVLEQGVTLTLEVPNNVLGVTRRAKGALQTYCVDRYRDGAYACTT